MINYYQQPIVQIKIIVTTIWSISTVLVNFNHTEIRLTDLGKDKKIMDLVYNIFPFSIQELSLDEISLSRKEWEQ